MDRSKMPLKLTLGEAHQQMIVNWIKQGQNSPSVDIFVRMNNEILTQIWQEFPYFIAVKKHIKK
jgi:hypothetical protein